LTNWLCHIKSVHQKNEKELLAISDKNDRLDRLCELNVIEQVNNISHTTIVQRAWRNNKELSVHGCIYNLETGLLKDLDVRYSEIDHTNEIYQLRETKKEIYKPA